jgi:hypothetical protein
VRQRRAPGFLVAKRRKQKYSRGRSGPVLASTTTMNTFPMVSVFVLLALLYPHHPRWSHAVNIMNLLCTNDCSAPRGQKSTCNRCRPAAELIVTKFPERLGRGMRIMKRETFLEKEFFTIETKLIHVPETRTHVRNVKRSTIPRSR